MARPLSPENKRLAQALFERGDDFETIAARIGCSSMTIRRHVSNDKRTLSEAAKLAIRLRDMAAEMRMIAALLSKRGGRWKSHGSDLTGAAGITSRWADKLENDQ